MTRILLRITSDLPSPAPQSTGFKNIQFSGYFVFFPLLSAAGRFFSPPRFSYHSLYLLPVLLFGFSNTSHTFEPTAIQLSSWLSYKVFQSIKPTALPHCSWFTICFFWKVILRIFSSRQFLSLTTNRQHYRTAAGFFFHYMRISFPGVHFKLRFIHKPLYYRTASGF